VEGNLLSRELFARKIRGANSRSKAGRTAITISFAVVSFLRFYGRPITLERLAKPRDDSSLPLARQCNVALTACNNLVTSRCNALQHRDIDLTNRIESKSS